MGGEAWPRVWPGLTPTVRRRRTTWRVRRSAARHAAAIQWCWRLPRRTAAVVPFQGRSLAVVDGPSAAVQIDDLFVRGIYDFACSTPTPVIVDAGANIGLATLRWQEIFRTVKVIALEPDPEIFRALTANVGDLEGTQLRQQALWAESGPVAFVRDGADGGRLAAGTDAAHVEAVTLTSILEEVGHVDLLKVDIEGSELAVLEAAAGGLADVDRMIIEYHSFTGHEQVLVELLALVRSAGFRVHLQTDDPSPQPLVAVSEYMGMDFQCNVFAWRPSQ